MEKSVKWSDHSHNRKTRRSLIVDELPPLEPYPFLSAKDYFALPDTDRAHIRLHNQAIKNAMVKLEDTYSVPWKTARLLRGAGKEVKLQEQDSCSRVPATTNDELEEPEELKPSIILMGDSQDYPYWSPTSGDAQHIKTRGHKLTIIPEASDGTDEARREETAVCDGMVDARGEETMV